MPKILLISDNEKQNKLITQLLAKNAITVFATTDESAIINYVEKALVSLVIIDESLKKQDSAILCKKIPAKFWVCITATGNTQ